METRDDVTTRVRHEDDDDVTRALYCGAFRFMRGVLITGDVHVLDMSDRRSVTLYSSDSTSMVLLYEDHDCRWSFAVQVWLGCS